MRSSLAALCFLAMTPLPAQELAFKAPALSPAAAKSVPGLALTFTAGGKSDGREARMVSLYVPAGQPATPFLAAGAFTARWQGEINSALKTEFQLSAEVRGQMKLSVNGKPLLASAGDVAGQSNSASVQLNKGANPVVIEFSSDGKTDASLLLKWASKEFPIEPIPPTVFSYQLDTPAIREGERLREGRLLFAQLRCASCHADATLIPARGEGMPELAQDAPVFAELGSKFNENWLAHWINDPHSIRPHSLMPRIFPETKPGQIDPRAADLAAFLFSQGKASELAPMADSVPLGGALFANLGCISCHTAPGFTGQDSKERTPLSHLKAKWQPAALREYLKDPAKHYAWTHMPNFRLSDAEVEQLTAFLTAGKQREFTAAPKGDAARGAQLLVSSGCLNCHAGMPPTTQPTLKATLKSSWLKGCMAVETASRSQAPDFKLTTAQREALLAFGASGFGALQKDVPVEFASRQIKNMQCMACHSRDAMPSIWSNLESEMTALQSAAPAQPEGEGIPQAGTNVPPLTWTGEKLQPVWMSEFIAGHQKYKPRPWIIARMPGFPTVAKGLSEGLAHEHGLAITPETEPVPNPEKVTNGATLLGENGGFNCTTCHGVGDRPPTAVFEAPGINLGYASTRLRKGYYQRWVLAPTQIDPESKMPRFADEEGKITPNDLYNGVAAEQYDAIWQYLRTQK